MRTEKFARRIAPALVVLLALTAAGLLAPPARAADYVPVGGAGSTWSSNAMDQWIRNVQQYGMKINFDAQGSTDGRNKFKAGTVDFAISEIPYGLTDGGVVDYPPADRGYAYMPIVAGGTAFMYNLKIGNNRVTNLRLSGDVLTKIFTGVITNWSDPAIKADNPSLSLPARKIVPVVRSDGSGTTAQLTTYFATRYSSLWNDYCRKAGRDTPCGFTSFYPLTSTVVAQSGSNGVSGYVAQQQNEGTITYVEYSYALNTGFPVAKVLNGSGYYIEPKASNVAVGLLKATIKDQNPSAPDYLTQDLRGVYSSDDPRAYPLSSYSYMILPTDTRKNFSTDKGHTLGDFGYYFLCEGQQQAEALGYSPLPINLVQAGLTQVKRIPGVNVQNVDIKRCNNPTFSADGTNTLAKNAPYPSECDKKGVTQCATGTGGAKKPTPVSGGGNGGGEAPNQALAGTGGGAGAGGGGPGGTGGGTAGSPAPGTAGSAAGAPAAGSLPAGTAGAIDPDTGQVIGAGSAGDTSGASAVPVSVDIRHDGRVLALRILVILLLLGLIAAPPIATHLLRDRSRS